MLRCAPSVPTAQHGLFTRSVITQGLHVSFLHSLFFVCPFVCTLFVHFIAQVFPRLFELWMLVTKATTQGLYFDWFQSLFLFVHLFVYFLSHLFEFIVFLCLTLFEPWLILCLCCVVLILFCQQKRQTKDKKKNITWSAPSFNFLPLDLFDHPGTVFYAVFMSFWGKIS